MSAVAFSAPRHGIPRLPGGTSRRPVPESPPSSPRVCPALRRPGGRGLFRGDGPTCNNPAKATIVLSQRHRTFRGWGLGAPQRSLPGRLPRAGVEQPAGLPSPAGHDAGRPARSGRPAPGTLLRVLSLCHQLPADPRPGPAGASTLSTRHLSPCFLRVRATDAGIKRQGAPLGCTWAPSSGPVRYPSRYRRLTLGPAATPPRKDTNRPLGGPCPVEPFPGWEGRLSTWGLACAPGAGLLFLLFQHRTRIPERRAPIDAAQTRRFVNAEPLLCPRSPPRASHRRSGAQRTRVTEVTLGRALMSSGRSCLVALAGLCQETPRRERLTLAAAEPEESGVWDARDWDTPACAPAVLECPAVAVNGARGPATPREQAGETASARSHLSERSKPTKSARPHTDVTSRLVVGRYLD
ncbi:uncharacterized protein LOC122241354 [Panthera tigris]|uniref:uncharacterized protein LOC122241354 n=1 Tax=Panthera tigris TaxID=9694 RepID=UPI001C6F7038|nr:uncharacterized protein LOC122241354 [Panthera tigris]